MKKSKARWDKQAIISEYLSSDQSYENLSSKYGIAARTIQTWVRIWRQANPGKKAEQEPITDKEKQLQAQLEQLQLKNELLEEMLKLSEELVGINLRKKFGTRQS